MSKGFLKKYLTDEQLRAIASRIAEQESRTHGEIHVSIRHRLHWKERKKSLHDVAIGEFHRLGMHRSRKRSGVLILLLFSERKFQIIADEGIHTKVPAGTWERMAEMISSHFVKGNFYDGICAAVDAVGIELRKYVPREAGDTDEISNDVDVS